MSWKCISISVFLVLLTKVAVGAIFFGFVFTDVHEGAATAFRAEGTEYHGIAMVGYVAWSLAFSFVFARGFENRGWLEGVRFGLIVWLLYFVPMTLGIYGYFVVGPEWTLFALISGLAESLACGSVAALVFRNAPRKTAAAA
jgi:hypothetical protein